MASSSSTPPRGESPTREENLSRGYGFSQGGVVRPPIILVVDADEQIRKLLHFHLRRSGAKVLQASRGEQALELIRQSERVDLVLLDPRLPDLPGMETLREINRAGKVGSTIVMTLNGTVADATAAMREGAYDFVNKTNTFDEVDLAIRNALNTLGLKRELAELKAQLDEREHPFGQIIGKSPAFTQVLKLAQKVRGSDITVLILGESGSGKEMVARAIHGDDVAEKRPFVALNCAAIPESLLESELFGHEKGAFTGASQRRVGKFAEADGGTLFLDEIGELGPGLQAKLLRVLQTREIQPIGGQPVRINVRILSATNQDLDQLVQQGRFRLDLYYRLAVFPIHIPPLRERREDILPLADHFLRRFSRQEHKSDLRLHPEVELHLLEHGWEGNVRELENMIYRAVVLTETGELTLSDFPILARPIGQTTSLSSGKSSTGAPLNLTQSVSPQSRPGLSHLGDRVPQSTAVVPLEQIELEAITRALTRTGGNISQAAIQLGIGRATLYRKFKKYGLSVT